jgi:hypothetical protein
MKILPLNIVIFFITVLSLPAIAQKNPADETNKAIVAALSSGNAAALSKYFNNMVDLGIAGNEDSYSNTQATRIVQDFFDKNKVKSVKITRQGTSNDGSQFSIGEMTAGNETFRIYYLLKKVSGQFLIQQLQIQQENS